MPYRLRITSEEVEAELRKMGFNNISEEMVESFRKDLLKLIKSDLRRLRKLKESQDESSFSKGFQKTNIHLQPSTSTPSSYLELEKEKMRQSEEYSTSEYGSGTVPGASERTSFEISQPASSEYSSSKSSEEKLQSRREEGSLVSVRKKGKLKSEKMSKDQEELPPYPERPDPVNLYHFYKAHWDKFKAPGEDPRSALRWEVRSRLFYSS